MAHIKYQISNHEYNLMMSDGCMSRGHVFLDLYDVLEKEEEITQKCGNPIFQYFREVERFYQQKGNS